MRILILGGYGVFGGRLAQLLADMPGLELLIAGRSLAKATAFCASYQGLPKTTPVALNRTDIHTRLAPLNPDLIVDASGPFQAYGADCYCVVDAAIEHRIPYLDFADSAEFVANIETRDAAAKSAGVG